MAKYPAKYDLAIKPRTYKDATSYGPHGYTVFRVLTDSASDVYNSPIADFKNRTHAEIFLKALRAEIEKKEAEDGE